MAEGSAFHNFYNHPLTMAAKIACMTSMVLLVWEPNVAAWASNILYHSVAGFGQIPAIFNAYAGGHVVMPMPGMETMVMPPAPLAPPVAPVVPADPMGGMHHHM